MKVLVIDATHGGLTISEAFSERGDNVTCIDVYRTLEKEDYDKYSGEFKIESELPNSFDLSKYDLIVRPVHFPSSMFTCSNGKMVTHHEAVKMLIYDKIKFPIVEITGSFGKTTAIKCAISILRDNYSILSLTSDGIYLTEEGHEKILLKDVSSTPANIIRALKLCPKEPDLAIFEVSLGGTGMADLGIIKNVYDNYSIAKGSSSALMAKISMVKNKKSKSTVLINADDPLLRGISGTQYFSTQHYSSEVSADRIRIGVGNIEFVAIFEGFMTMGGPAYSRISVEAHERPVGRQHLENMLVGVSIARFFGELEDHVEFPPEVFGKKMVLEDPSGPLVLNRSPAINEKVVATSIRDYIEVLPPARLELGGRLKTTCGSVQPKALAEILNSSNFEEIHLFGELGEALKPLMTKRSENEVYFEKAKVPTLRLERG